MTLDPRPASPGTNVPSRNRSAPLELFNPSTVAVTTDRQPRYSPQRLVGPGPSNGKTAADRPGTSGSARIVHAAEDGSVLGLIEHPSRWFGARSTILGAETVLLAPNGVRRGPASVQKSPSRRVCTPSLALDRATAVFVQLDHSGCRARLRPVHQAHQRRADVRTCRLDGLTTCGPTHASATRAKSARLPSYGGPRAAVRRLAGPPSVDPQSGMPFSRRPIACCTSRVACRSARACRLS